MRILITGTAGFIGFHLARRLLEDGHQVTGIDAISDYYDVRLKQARHALLRAYGERFSEHVTPLEDAEAVLRIGQQARPEVIVHLAAQAGVRYSLENPRAYIDSNLVGAFNIMEVARLTRPGHFLLASTSSAYGVTDADPSAEAEAANHPITLYAATKKANEAMSHSYSHLWDLPTTALRFFTVYGPWGRPDMALFKFVAAILEDQPIDLYNGGEMMRDFTFIDDLVEGLVRLIARPPEAGKPVSPQDSLSPSAPWRVVNIGNGAPASLMDFVAAVEAALGRPARRNLLPMQAGDVPATFANVELLRSLTGYTPRTSVTEGVKAFCDWYLDFYSGR